MKTIIVPTDFSPVSLNAVNFAVDMALAIKAKILLFNACHVPVVYSGDFPVELISVDELKKTSETKLEDLKRKISYTTSGRIDLATETRIGDTVDELQELCKNVKPFAVVMGSKGKTGLDKVVLGSTTLTTIRHLKWPVICVPPGKYYGKGIKKIGLACDFREVKKTIPLPFIKEIMKVFDAELHIVNVDYKEKHFRPETPEEAFQLYDMFRKVNPKYHFIDHPDIEDGILEFAKTNNLDLIIVIPKKHKLLEGIFKPGSTKQLIFGSHVPIMSMHE